MRSRQGSAEVEFWKVRDVRVDYVPGAMLIGIIEEMIRGIDLMTDRGISGAFGQTNERWLRGWVGYGDTQ